MPDKVINYDNLTRFKSDLDPLLAEKAEAGDVYSKSAFDTLLGGKQAKLTAEQLAEIAAVPGKQDAMEPISDGVIDIMFGDFSGVDPVLANNSWEIIKMVCEAGVANNYWAVGDTKTDVGTDSTTRTFRICDMYNAYPDRVVFEQVELESTDYQWNSSANNNYSLSQMRTTHLPTILLKYSNELQSFIVDTTYKVATNGNNGTLLDLTDKLFLPAERELYGTRIYSRAEEWDTLTQFQYYVTHSSNADHIKHKLGATSAVSWWGRSPASGNTSFVSCVGYSGGNYGVSADSSTGVAPCFTF